MVISYTLYLTEGYSCTVAERTISRMNMVVYLRPVSDRGVFAEGGTQCSKLFSVALQIHGSSTLLVGVVIKLE